MKNFHLPLPEALYTQLRERADATGTPATALAREAIEQWLSSQRRRERHDSIAAYATRMAGTEADLDVRLEAAASGELLRATEA